MGQNSRVKNSKSRCRGAVNLEHIGVEILPKHGSVVLISEDWCDSLMESI